MYRLTSVAQVLIVLGLFACSCHVGRGEEATEKSAARSALQMTRKARFVDGRPLIELIVPRNGPNHVLAAIKDNKGTEEEYNPPKITLKGEIVLSLGHKTYMQLHGVRVLLDCTHANAIYVSIFRLPNG